MRAAYRGYLGTNQRQHPDVPCCSVWALDYICMYPPPTPTTAKITLLLIYYCYCAALTPWNDDDDGPSKMPVKPYSQ